jgi:hypothetical protein
MADGEDIATPCGCGCVAGLMILSACLGVGLCILLGGVGVLFVRWCWMIVSGWLA